MNSTRRSFLRGLFAAPAIVAASSLMPINSRLLLDIPPRLWGDGIHDDAPVLQWMLATIGEARLPEGRFFVGSTLDVSGGRKLIGRGAGSALVGADGITVVRLGHNGEVEGLFLQAGAGGTCLNVRAS